MPPAEGSAPLQVIFNVSRQLARMGHDVIILDRKYSADDLSQEQVDGVDIARLNAWQVPFGRVPKIIRFVMAEFNAVLFALAVSRYLKINSSSIDVIHLHLTSIGLIVGVLNRRLRSKMFYTCHLSQWALSPTKIGISERIHLFLDSLVMKWVSKVIALNNAARESFIIRGKVSAAKIVVLPNGVDTGLFSQGTETYEATRRKYGLEGKTTVLFVGRLAKIKGIEHLIRAADIIVNRYDCRDIQFILAGSYAYEGVDDPVNIDEMTGYIRQNHLEKSIVFTGSLPLEEIRVLYAACDIFVLPSLAEGDPLVTLEAMASGKPIIGTRVGGIPNQIRDGWNGFLIEPGNEKEIADRIKYLLDNPQEIEKMGTNSRRYAEEEFDWRIITKRLLRVYEGT
ncbi:glycosyltransferase family 4 protein [Chloroflexota bacterium]